MLNIFQDIFNDEFKSKFIKFKNEMKKMSNKKYIIYFRNIVVVMKFLFEY